MTNNARKEIASQAVDQLQQRLEQGATVLKGVLAEIQPRKGRGGVRLGAGRPLEGEQAASMRVIFRLTPEEAKLLEEQRQEGESTHQTARRVLLASLAKPL